MNIMSMKALSNSLTAKGKKIYFGENRKSAQENVMNAAFSLLTEAKFP